MTGPYMAKKMRIRITEDGNQYVLGVVERVNVELRHQGEVEFKYGMKADAYDRPDNRHRIGMKRANFTIRRWFKTDDNSPTDLLFDLYENSTWFWLDDYLNPSVTGIAGMRGVTLSGCVAYSYRLVTGGANDIVAEEILGECLDWQEKT